MRQREVRFLAPDGRGTEQVYPQRVEGLFPGDTGQEDAVAVKDLRLAELEGHARRPGVGKPGLEQVRVHEGKLILPAQCHVRGNEAALNRVEKPTHGLDLAGLGFWQVEAPLDALRHGVTTFSGDALHQSSAAKTTGAAPAPASAVTGVFVCCKRCWVAARLFSPQPPSSHRPRPSSLRPKSLRRTPQEEAWPLRRCKLTQIVPGRSRDRGNVRSCKDRLHTRLCTSSRDNDTVGIHRSQRANDVPTGLERHFDWRPEGRLSQSAALFVSRYPDAVGDKGLYVAQPVTNAIAGSKRDSKTTAGQPGFACCKHSSGYPSSQPVRLHVPPIWV